MANLDLAFTGSGAPPNFTILQGTASRNGSGSLVASIAPYAAYHNVAPFSVDLEIDITLSAISFNGASIFLGFDPGTFNGYYLVVSVPSIQLFELNTGVPGALLASVSRTSSASDVIGVRKVGPVFRLVVNGTLTGSAGNSGTYPNAGYAGLGLISVADTVSHFAVTEILSSGTTLSAVVLAGAAGFFAAGLTAAALAMNSTTVVGGGSFPAAALVVGPLVNNDTTLAGASGFFLAALASQGLAIAAVPVVGLGNLPALDLQVGGLVIDDQPLAGAAGLLAAELSIAELNFTPATLFTHGVAVDAELQGTGGLLLGETAYNTGVVGGELAVGGLDLQTTTAIATAGFPASSVSPGPLTFDADTLVSSANVVPAEIAKAALQLVADVIASTGTLLPTSMTVSELMLTVDPIVGLMLADEATLSGGSGLVATTIPGPGVVGAATLLISGLPLAATSAINYGVVAGGDVQLADLDLPAETVQGISGLLVAVLQVAGLELQAPTLVGQGLTGDGELLSGTVFVVDPVVGFGTLFEADFQLGTAQLLVDSVVGLGIAQPAELLVDALTPISLQPTTLVGQSVFPAAHFVVGVLINHPLFPLIKVTQLFDEIKARLDNENMAQLTGALHRVYRVEADLSQPEGRQDAPWGRVVIVPTQYVWGENPMPGIYRTVSFLIRVEFNRYISPGYDVSYILEAVHSLCNSLLEGFAPVMRQALVTLPVYLNTPPQTSPLWDDSRQLWFSSAEYRCEVTYKVSL